MQEFDPGALLARYYPLARGPRVCLRLVRSRDLDGIRRLLESQGVGMDELELARLVRADPRQAIVICATALVDGAEALVGFGATDVTPDAQPNLLVVDESLTGGLDELLREALRGRARKLSVARAA